MSIFASRSAHESPKWSSLARRWAWHERENMDQLVPAMREFLNRDYFSRTWIYQEIVLGRHIILCCGCTRTPPECEEHNEGVALAPRRCILLVKQ